MHEGAFDTAQRRHDAMQSLLEKLGALVNPRYARVMKDISRGNLVAASAKTICDKNAPALLWDLYA